LAKATAAITEMTNRTSSERLPLDPSGSFNVRASAGSAGAHVGLNAHTPSVYAAYRPVSTKPGMNAPAYMSPTDFPSWSAMMMSTSDGGMICASVPEAAITPEAKRRS
jgi:hypothetical protein